LTAPDRRTLRRVSGATSRAPLPPGSAAGRGPAREVIDYTLNRRATLANLRAGRISPMDACDAHPYLLRAARFHGEPAELDCPVCRREQLTHVTYTYGDSFRADTNGRVRQTQELPELANEHSEFRVYVVEVCQACGWNHLVRSYVLGQVARHSDASGAATQRERRRSKAHH
jgi:hypothetical protein